MTKNDSKIAAAINAVVQARRDRLDAAQLERRAAERATREAAKAARQRAA